ncbi:MAG TPA: carboxymuconolactone decarboxylase family protein [Pirellulales bacterium]
MQARLDYAQASPEATKAMYALQGYVNKCSIEHSLQELVKIRASQINGCAFCLDMHTKDARSQGETEQRIYLLNAWREAPFYTPRERAALAWTEAVTMIREGVSDEVFAEVREQFNDKELADLTLVVTAINAWNRVAISFHTVPGSYQPAKRVAAAAV